MANYARKAESRDSTKGHSPCVASDPSPADASKPDNRRNEAHLSSCYFDLEPLICDVNGATKLFLHMFREVFDHAPQETRGCLEVYVIDPDTVTAMVHASRVLLDANRTAFEAYYEAYEGKAGA